MIQCIRTYRLRHQLAESFGFSQWHYDTRNALFSNGVVTVPTAPGLGVEPNRTVMTTFTVQETENHK